MADYRNDDDRTLPGGPGMNRTPETDPEHLLPDHTSAPAVPGLVAGGVSGDPDAVRDEIERTRERMSSTIEQIEGALLRKKGEIQERLDVVAPVRERPWIFAAGVFGTGLVLGLLTGGGDDDRDVVKVPRSMLAGLGMQGTGDGDAGGYGLSGHAGEWENRSRELMQVVARQEEEIRDLRAALYDEDYSVDGFAELGGDAEFRDVDALGDVDVADEWDEEWNYDDGGDALDDFGAFGVEGEGGGFLGKAVAAAVAAGLAGVLGGVGKKLVQRRGRGGEMDVEVDLEPRGYSATDVRVDEDYLAARREGRAGGAYGGEMEVEVELDRPYTGAYRAPGEYAAGQGEYGRELEVEVEMEQPRRYAGESYEAPRGRSLPVSPLSAAVAAGAAALVGGLVARLVHNRSHGEEMDVEVELEERPAYRPSAPRQPAATRPPAPRPTAATGGELQVEVELEERGGQAGYTSSPQPLTAERTYEVELERPGGASATGSTGTTGSAGVTASGTTGSTGSGSTGRGPADPPLM
jgi:hypothetical protein